MGRLLAAAAADLEAVDLPVVVSDRVDSAAAPVGRP